MPIYSDLYSNSYLDTYGIPFSSGGLGLYCDLSLANVWTDVSSYVYQRSASAPSVRVTRGKPNESQLANPSSATWEWKNVDGRFSPLNPIGPYYGQLGRNTPVRFSTSSPTNYLRLENQDGTDKAHAFASPNAAFNITGNLEARISLRLTDWQPAFLFGRWGSSKEIWALTLNADGTVTFYWTTGGTAATKLSAQSTMPLPFTRKDFSLRVVFTASTGTAAFYTAATIDGTYTQLGSSVSGTSGASTSLYNDGGTVTELDVGYSSPLDAWSYGSMHGRVNEARLYNSSSTVVADGIFSSKNPGDTTWTDSASRTWTLAGAAEISSRNFRYFGQMSAQPPTWDKTGRDMAVAATAGGLLRLTGQGQQLVSSPQYRAISTQTGAASPVEYWPQEESTGATSFGSAVGTLPMTFSVAPSFGANSNFPSSKPLSNINGAVYSGTVRSYTGAPWNANTNSGWSVQFIAQVANSDIPGSGSNVLGLFHCAQSGAGIAYVVFQVNSGGSFQAIAYSATGVAVGDTGPCVIAGASITDPFWWSISLLPQGVNCFLSAEFMPLNIFGYGQILSALLIGTLGFVDGVTFNPSGIFSSSSVGHAYVQAQHVPLTFAFNPFNAWNGETAGNRFARLCKENGFDVRIIGAPSVSAPMGYQSIGTFPTVIQECETADMGQIFESRDSLSLVYRTLASIENQAPITTLDYSQAMIGGAGESMSSGLSPTYDDFSTNNDWTVTRGNNRISGSTYRATLNDGSSMSVTVVGYYSDSETANLYLDSQLSDVAWWLVHLGTVNEARWPAIPINLLRSAIDTQVSNCILMDIGDSVSATNLPNTVIYDPVGQIVLGMEEDLGVFYWWISINGAPASVYNTGIYDDLIYGRADTDGSTLTAGITSGATSFQVTTTDTTKPVWTLSAGDFPFDINIGGERMTVSNITSATSPQTFTISARAVNGVVKAHNSGEDVRLWFPPIYAIM
jgi:hypothetical protein